MKQRLLGLLLVLPLVMVGGAQKADLKFKEFAPKGAGYSIQMPGEPKEQKHSVKTPVGTIDIIMYAVEPDPNASFVLAYSDYPDAALKGATDDQRLDGARDGAAGNVKGKILSEKKITLGKYPGREVVIEIPTKGQLRSRMYMVDHRLYQVMVGGTKELTTSKDADKFLGSFKLTKK
jgi:hypothetical protein